MYQVNLLPWRQRRRRRRARVMAIALAAELLLALGITGCLGLRWREEQSALGTRLALLRQQELQVRRQWRQQQRRMALCEGLHGALSDYRRVRRDNQRYCRFFQLLPALPPSGLWFTSLRLREDGVAAEGCSRDYAAIVETSGRLGRHPMLAPAHWHEITRLENGLLRFRLQTQWVAEAVNDAFR